MYISVPSHLRAKFSEMAPIFKNVKVGREHLGDRMLCLARQRGYLDVLKDGVNRLVGVLGMRPALVVARWRMVGWSGWLAKGVKTYVILRTGVRCVWVSVHFL